MPDNGFAGLSQRFLSNDPSLFGAPINDEPLRGRIRAEQIASILRYTPYMLLASLINAIVLGMAFTGTAGQTAALVWCCALSGFVLYAYMRWRVAQRQARRTYASVRGPRRVIVNALILGMIWAALPLLFLGYSNANLQVLVVAATIGMMCGGAFALTTVPAAAVAFVTPIVLATVAAAYLYQTPYGLHLGFLLVLFAFVIARASYSQACQYVERLLGEYEQEKQRDMIGILLGEFEENANDWLWETDTLGRIVYVSSRFADMIQRPMDALVGKSLLRVLGRGFDGPPEPEAVWRRVNEHFHNRTPFRGLELKVNAGGNERWCSLTGKPITSSAGQFAGFRGFCTDNTDKRADEAKILYLARFDSITGLPNRVSFTDRIDACLAELARKNEPFALHCIDLDGFKEINDTFGHAIGDAFLHEMGNRIGALLGPDDFVARLGGDEFAIIQLRVNSDYEATDLARSIIEAARQTFSIAGNTMHAGASVGIALAPRDGDARDRLMVNGDLALYQAKSRGRGTYCFFDVSMDEVARERRKIEAGLHSALRNNEFQLWFQPIMNVESGSITNCEALLRWDSPTLGAVSPATFVPIAEECGLIIKIGEWVIVEACRQAALWPSDIKVAVNLSAVQFQSPGLLPAIMRALETSAVEAKRLEVEITETVLLSNVERASAIIDTLERLGVGIALDDFGTGYSSLAYIRQINFDKIKIDASFVREMLTDRSCAAIIRAVTGLARELDIRITAEGVETEEQMRILREQGCTELQGYLISEPLPAGEFARFIRGSITGEARQVA